MMTSLRRCLLLLIVTACLPVQAEVPRHNPFAQLGNSGGNSRLAASASSLQLRGIITGSRGSAANINGTILSIGESFRGYKLLSADENGAELLGPSGPVTLELQRKGDTTNAR